MGNPEHVEIVLAGAEAIRDARIADPTLRFDLTAANFVGANLSGSNLYNADLSDANLLSVNLSAANLSSAILSGANVSHSDVTNAILSGATMWGVNLSSAILSGANLSKAKLGWTVFAANDLRGVIGLETVEHRGPSELSISTLYNSNGNIPRAFLLGCGVPGEIIDRIISHIGRTSNFYSCFISYSHADKQFACQLHDRLQDKGIRCWLDEHAMKPGDDIYAAVDKGIRLYDKILFCASKESLNSWWVERELDTAIEKEMEFRKAKGEQILKVIPLNLDGSLFEWTEAHAATLRKRLAPDFTNWKRNADKFEEQFERVVKALRTDDGPPAPVAKLGT